MIWSWYKRILKISKFYEILTYFLTSESDFNRNVPRVKIELQSSPYGTTNYYSIKKLALKDLSISVILRFKLMFKVEKSQICGKPWIFHIWPLTPKWWSNKPQRRVLRTIILNCTSYLVVSDFKYLKHPVNRQPGYRRGDS